MAGKKLVAYFSASGRTAKAAKTLAQAADAELYEIRPEALYTTDDLNWHTMESRSSKEMSNPASRPALAEKPAGMDAYDVIFVGFPIWWHVAPTIINTFLEGFDTAGKTIVLFATSGSEGFGQTAAKLKSSLDASAKLVEGKILRGSVTADELRPWLGALGV